MLLATHSLVGAFIGKEVGYPPLAFLLGAISHILLDCVPHADGPDDNLDDDDDSTSLGQYALVFADIAIAGGLFIVLSSAGHLSSGMIWGAIGGIFPDVVDNVPFWSPKLQRLPVFKQFHQFHYNIQKIKLPIWLGLAFQYLTVAIFFWLLLR